MRVRPTSLRPLLLATPLALVSAAAARYAVWFLLHSEQFQVPIDTQTETLKSLPAMIESTRWVALGFAAALLVCFLVGLCKRALGLHAARLGYWLTYGLMGFVVFFSITAGDRLAAAAMHLSIPPGLDFIFAMRSSIWAVGLIGLVAAVLHGLSFTRPSLAAYNAIPPARPDEDELLVNVRAQMLHGRYRRSMFASVFTHLMILFVIPWVAQISGCMQAYVIPGDGGGGGGGKEGTALNTQEEIKIKPKKAQKPQKRRRFIVRADSNISFFHPTIDDSDAYAAVSEESELEYEANNEDIVAQVMALSEAGDGGGSGGGSGMGKGKGKGLGSGDGTGTGWGMGKGGMVRFIRIEYSGRDWDDGMDAISRADRNILDFFHKVSNLKVSDRTESNRISQLKGYPKGQAPPFLYMTGSESINISTTDAQALRKFLLDGSLLFADAGSPQWDQSFRSFVRAVFPDKELVVISKDDPIFRNPFQLPNGAPPLWHHGGEKAMGIKHQGRWVVFYFPGDVNDAWKTGHSGLDKKLADRAYELSVNVMVYSFNQYFRLSSKDR